MKIFISYSHADTDLKDKFLIHFQPIAIHHEFQIFHDDMIDAGEHLDDTIRQHLAAYDIIIFLISPEFLSSNYCTNIELQHALDNKRRIVPILIRSCSWKYSKLSNLKIIPRDAQPISESKNSDKAWSECCEHIAEIAKKIKITPKQENETVAEEAIKNLLKLEINIQHRFKNHIDLNDIFIYPDLKYYDKENDEEIIINAEKLIKKVDKKTLILGDEQSGKRSLAKKLFLETQKQNPSYYINAEHINRTDIKKILGSNNLFCLHNNSTLNPRDAHRHQTNIFIIDNFNNISIGKQHHQKLFDNLSERFESIIIISSTTIANDEIFDNQFMEFTKYEILPFGYERREKLYEKWICLGQEEQLEEHEIEQRKNYLKSHINSFLRKNIVPAKPIFILTAIQHLEIRDNSNTTLTSLGHCYQSLITQSLKKVKITNTNIDSYINLMSLIAFEIYQNNKHYLTEPQMLKFVQSYTEKFHSPKPVHDMINELKNANLLSGDSYTKFKYRYIYYYFAAKQITKKIDESGCNIIEELCSNLYSEIKSNILLFVCHHTDNPKVIDEIRLNTLSTFENITPLKLTEESLKVLESISSDVEKAILDHQESDQTKKEADNHDNEAHNEDYYSEYNDTMKDLINSAKSIEIIGQIVKNRFGSIEKSTIKEMTLETYDSGLKFLKFYTDMILENADDIAEILIQQANNSYNLDINQERSKLINDAKKQIMFICYNAIIAVIRKISSSIGTHHLIEIFESIFENETASPAYKLISLCIMMEHSTTLPKKQIEELLRSGSPVIKKITQYLAYNYLYLYEISRTDREWLSQKLNISLDYINKNLRKETKILEKSK